MKQKTSTDELIFLFKSHEEKIRAIVKEEIREALKEIISQEKTPSDLPPIIQRAKAEGLLQEAVVNGKCIKREGKKDADIIEWMVDYSGYEDTLTADLYIQFIQTNVKPQSICQYISRSFREAKNLSRINTKSI